MRHYTDIHVKIKLLFYASGWGFDSYQWFETVESIHLDSLTDSFRGLFGESTDSLKTGQLLQIQIVHSRIVIEVNQFSDNPPSLVQ